ncbi:MAG: PilZ domain-containing protein [Desulfobacterales bacterium]|nr:PilZ domain-containing protein [Desulfobacterales bacterium]
MNHSLCLSKSAGNRSKKSTGVAPHHLDCIPKGRQYSLNGIKIGKAHLINTFNFINFSNGTVLVNFRHPQFNDPIAFLAKPCPCLNDTVECAWSGPDSPGKLNADYMVKDILVPRGQNLFLVNPDQVRFNGGGILFRVPDGGVDVNSREFTRNPCQNIQAKLRQGTAVLNGSLVDFNTVAFCIAETAGPPQKSPLIDTSAAVNMEFSSASELLYAGEGRIAKQTGEGRNRKFIITPTNSQVPQLRSKEFRTARQELTPPPDITFKHPFTHRTITMKAIDIAGSGFSVAEEADRSVLLPGLLIPELELHFASSFKVRCKAQVIYRTGLPATENGKHVKCGLALIEISPRDHVKLLSLLYQTTNHNAYLCNPVDLDALWEFFFEAGFIYPDKYGFFHQNKETIKATYHRLYTENHDIARHFIYQDKGRILGHMAMVRFYEKAWLIHHHAARRADFTRAGLVVLNQIGRYINDSHSLKSSKMDYVFCYFRPDNKFPARVFGGSARRIGDPEGCSLDSFAYLHYSRIPSLETGIAPPWHLAKTDAGDLLSLRRFYARRSGGLMLKALELEPGLMEIAKLRARYSRAGLRRSRLLFSLKRNDDLIAIFILNISDIGLNMSELTNCITVIVLEPDSLPGEIFQSALACQAEYFQPSTIPVLLYPETYAQATALNQEKAYTLWILNMTHTDHYFRYMRRLLKRFDR